MTANPFTPNFGQIPKYIAGRSQIISEIEQSWIEPGGGPARTSIFIGARGTGKTALLSYFSEKCGEQGWISVNVSCIPGVQEDILQQIRMRAGEFISHGNTVQLKGLSIGQLFGVEWENRLGQNANWRTVLTQMLDELAEYGIGLLLTIDEVTPSLDEMIQIASVYQHLVRENRNISLLMAGLPSEVSALLNDRSVSFLRRASQYTLGRIEDYEVEDAFRRTIAESGKEISSEALKAAVDVIDGFPYMLQLVGYRTWQQSGEESVIDVEMVEQGVRLAKKDFETRVLQATVRELSAGDLAFLKTMLADREYSEISKVEKRLDKSSGYVSRYRGRLLERGVIETCGRGKIRFALPELKDYLLKADLW